MSVIFINYSPELMRITNSDFSSMALEIDDGVYRVKFGYTRYVEIWKYSSDERQRYYPITISETIRGVWKDDKYVVLHFSDRRQI